MKVLSLVGGCAYDEVADLSLYIFKGFRGKGIGTKILIRIERFAKENAFHKIVLSTFPFNALGQNLYQKKGYREVGVFKNHGILNGKFVDVMVMKNYFRKIHFKFNT
jgi:RimJ/RimL family protein N-acetyltransferase